MKRVRVIIKGLVQGVFFRAFLKYHADRLKIKGRVKNTASGDVEAVFEGEEKAIKEILKLARKGPRHAVVKELIIKEEPYSNEFSGFEILYE